MINGIGLFAALGTPDAAQPQTAPAEDPAVFAAALVAALGLQQPVQVTIAPPQPVVEGEAATEDGEEPQVEGDAATMTTVETEEAPEQVAPVVARVTPDPEAVEETKTFERIPVAKGKVPKRQAIDVVSDEPATPVQPKDEKTVRVEGKAEGAKTPAATRTATPIAPAAPVANAAPVETDVAVEVDATVSNAPIVTVRAPAPITLPPEVVTSKAKLETQPVAPRNIRKPAKEYTVEAEPTAVAPIQSGVAPIVPCIVPPVEMARDTAEVEAREPEANTSEPAAPRSSAPVADPAPFVAPAPIAAPVPTASTAPVPGTPAAPTVVPARPDIPVDFAIPEDKVPPQSVQERTARAMAENVRVGRQLAELLGEENITELKIELGKRPEGEAKPVALPKQQQPTEERSAPVTWQRMSLPQSGDTISGQMLPQDTMTPKAPRKAVQGTFAQEALEPVITRPFNREPVTITTVTSRPEIVRMVANASLAISPNLAQTEGNPAVAKAPAPSVTPSLPAVRQELPAPAPSSRTDSSDDRERPRASESASSADASASSIASANNSQANKPASAPENGRESREARNLPSHESTDQKAAGSADRVTLQVADDEGRQTRIRVSVTGSQIRAVITPPDTMSARQLEQRMDQLHETLVRQGFTDPKVVVRAAPEMGSDAAALAASSQDVRSAGPAGKDQPAGDQRQGRGQREQDRGDGHRHPQGHSRGRDPRDRRR